MGSDSWRTANGVYAGPDSLTRRHGVGRSLVVGRRSGALRVHDRVHGVRVVGCCSVIVDGSACTGAPGSSHGRADETSARVLHYMCLCSADYRTRCAFFCVRIGENQQNVNVLVSGCECGDASCFVACRRDKSDSVGPETYLQTQNIPRRA